MKSPYDIILRPVLTEKSYDAMAEKKYTFEVAVDAGKTEIKMAVEPRGRASPPAPLGADNGPAGR